MSEDLPNRADIVVIGGGIVGCSVAYHLARQGLDDVVLLERSELTSGTTWHAAGLVGQLRATRNLTRLAFYSADLYEGLEAETGQATGFLRNGSVSLAQTQARLEELRRGASMARAYGVEVSELEVGEIRERWPLARTDDLAGGIYLPGDGRTNPVDTTMALARGARQLGARLFEDRAVTAIETLDSRVSAVLTDEGRIECRVIVNCAGMWAREIGLMAGVAVPLHAAEHFYLVTEPLEGGDGEIGAGVGVDVPTLRDPDSCLYVRAETGGRFLVGFFEPRAKPWGMGGIPDDFAFRSLPADYPHLEPQIEAMLHRLPALEDVGIELLFNGPESFTPDDRYLLGQAPELDGFFVAAGFNSIGIQSAGGAGRVLAEWIRDGEAPMDLWDVDISRMQTLQNDAEYLQERTVEGLGLLYAMNWPHRQFETARDRLVSPLHGRLAAAGACFGELAGWERANWYAEPGDHPVYEYSWGRTNWFERSAREHLAVRDSVGIFDQTSFTKLDVEGPDAGVLLGRICANDIDVDNGRIVYTQWLNERGGIEADLTITRLADERYLVVGYAVCRRRDAAWLRRRASDGEGVSVRDVTEDFAVLGVMGPRSRELLREVSDADLSNDAFPFGTSREINVAGHRLRASRVSYVGELGWELYIPRGSAVPVYDAVRERGSGLGLVHAGYHAMDSLRMEKACREWGHDVTPDESPLEAGLGFAVAWDKPGGFIGRNALLEQRSRPLGRRLVQFALRDPEPLLFHDEPIRRNGEIVGSITSGAFGHSLGRSLGMGYVENEDGVSADFIRGGVWEIEVAGTLFEADASLRPFFDPRHERLRRTPP